MTKQLQPIATYINDQGYTVTVYPEKKVKRRPWQRGEAYLSQQMRISDDRMFARFTRKNGKY